MALSGSCCLQPLLLSLPGCVIGSHSHILQYLYEHVNLPIKHSLSTLHSLSPLCAVFNFKYLPCLAHNLFIR